MPVWEQRVEGTVSLRVCSSSIRSANLGTMCTAEALLPLELSQICNGEKHFSAPVPENKVHFGLSCVLLLAGSETLMMVPSSAGHWWAVLTESWSHTCPDIELNG